MIERVARALYECPGSDMVAKYDHAFPEPGWDRARPAVKDDCRVRARAAIEAMREPSDALVRPDGTDFWMPYFDRCREDDVAGIWRLMIDEALKTK